MEPIEEIESKKRRTRIENAQRSAAYLRTSASKERKESSTAASANKQPTTDADSLDFSSEFTNQDTGLSSNADSTEALNWDELLEDDEWLDDNDDDEEGGHGQHQQESQEPEPEEDSVEQAPAPTGFGAWKPPASSGFKKWTPQSSTPAAPKPVEAAEPVEKQLGYEWGEVKKPEETGPAVELDGPAVEDTPSVRPFNPPPKKLPPRKSELQAGVIPAHQNPASYIPPRPRPEPLQTLPTTGRLEGVESRVISAARLLITTPEGEPGYEECVRLLCRFGLGALRLCSRQKVRVAILDEHQFPDRPELAEFKLDNEELPVDGAYIVKSRTCLIDRRCLLEKPRFFHPALYYFSHALDHAQGGESFSSRKAAAVRVCFEASTEGLNGCDFVDELAAADPVRYFARSVAIYLGRDDCLEPIWTHQDLHDFDKSMYDYLAYLFARFSV